MVGSARELKSVLTDDFIPLLDGRTLPIKFRIEEGALTNPGEIASGGFDHTCAVASDGKAYCWGRNFNGQLGIGVAGGKFNTPQPVATSLTFQSVQASKEHTCGLTTGGQMYCWGRDAFGQLGIGSGDFSDHPTPEPVLGGHTFQSLASLGTGNGASTCGVTTAGDMCCWGLNNVGQLGTGEVTFTETKPVMVTGGHTFAGPDAMQNRFTCAVTTVGDAYCWGVNESGQLGNGNFDLALHDTPELVLGGHEFQSIAAGAAHACGINTAGAALCWGRNKSGQLGLGTITSSSPFGFATPQLVTGGHTFTQLSAGFIFNCGVRTDGAGFCWGGNSGGSLGSGMFSPTTVPTPGVVVGGHTFHAIGAGDRHACGVTTGGDTFCWGRNRDGELGDGTFANNATPQFAIDLDPTVP